MKKGDIAQGRVEKVDFPNKGKVLVADEEGTVVTVKNACPGQVVEFAINKKRHGSCEGRLLSVVERAECEIESPCPHFNECGGCLYQTYPYEEQLKIKEQQILDLIKPDLSKTVHEGIIGSPKVFGYRNKMEFSFGDEYKDGPLALGMHKRGSFYDIVTTTECKIVDDDYNNILKVTLDYFAGLELPFFHKLSHEGILRHLCVRKGGKLGEILVFLVTSSQWSEKYTEEEWMNILNAWKDKLLEIDLIGQYAGILHITNDSLADVVKDEGTIILHGKDYFEEELLGLKFKISPFSFFQNNSEGAEKLYSKVREYLLSEIEGKPVVFDLYTGTGTIAQLVAPVCEKVVGVEIIEEAVEAAKISADRNGLTNLEFIAGDVLKVIDDITEKPDYIILDPPRDGIHPKALTKILDYGVNSIVYVSCKPSSLARDLESFYEYGYELKKMCVVDMFPVTTGVETVCLLVNQNANLKFHFRKP